ncbi:MAG: DUF4147 domain-containing protein [Gammaproteobacteria bacterium]|nr:DUF4147 domain-containing protein [Gammaproteobacteria bacterium]
MIKTEQPKQFLTDLFHSALNVVNGCSAVECYFNTHPIEGNVAVVAIGKAAPAMMLGAKNVLTEQIQSALIITKAGHADSQLGWPCIEAGHPIPNKKSLEAGASLIAFLSHIPKETKLVTLISGGASALVEVLPENVDLEVLIKINNWLLASGLPIHEINHIRQAVSLIKGGKALGYFHHNEITQLLISDVKMDMPEIIGSGLFVARKSVDSLHNADMLPVWLQKYIHKVEPAVASVSVKSHIIANNEMACQAIIKRAEKTHYAVTYHGQSLYGDVFKIAELLVKELLNAKPGIHLWGGEPTLRLPAEPGRGGRNQSLALAIACLIENSEGITVLVGATDGSDGPTDDAGAIIDGATLARARGFDAKVHLAAADAGTFLAEAGDLISTGPTGTNVMDIVIALKESI